MAKKRKTKKSSHRRRRISGIGGLNTSAILGNIAGAAIAGELNSMLTKIDPATSKPKVDPKIVALGSMAAGVLLPRFLKGDLGAGVGAGLIAAGGLNALKSFNIISGIPTISGYQDMRTVSGIPQQYALPAGQPAYNTMQVISGFADGYTE